MIKNCQFRQDGRRNEWTTQQLAEGAALQALVDAGIGDLTKLEVTITKAGYTQDSFGQFLKWFDRQGRLDSGEVATVRDYFLVPTPHQFAPAAIGSLASQRW